MRLNVTGTGVHVDVGGAVAVGRVVVALFVHVMSARSTSSIVGEGERRRREILQTPFMHNLLPFNFSSGYKTLGNPLSIAIRRSPLSSVV